MQLTLGSNNLTYNVSVSTQTKYLTTYKKRFNGFLLTPDFNYLVINAKDLYLKKSMTKHEYYKIVLRLVPKYTIDKHYLV